MRSMKLTGHLLLVAATLLFLVKSASAVVLEELLDRNLVNDAELIVSGEVAAITDTLPAPGDFDDRPLPHTVVGIQIDEVLKGSIAQDTDILNVRMMGGSDGESLLVLNGQPLFDLGDRGLFFVRGNGEANVPFVGMRQGFIRFLEDGELILNDQGDRMIASQDPLYAAQIHPRDVENYLALGERIMRQERAVDEAVWNNLSEITRQFIENGGEPTFLEMRDGNTVVVDPDRITVSVPPELASIQWETLGQTSVNEFFQTQVLPPRYAVQSQNLFQAMMLRDLNHLLMNPQALPPAVLELLELRPQTEELGFSQPGNLTLKTNMLRTRRILEDAYPQFMVRSANQTMIRGEYIKHPEIMNNLIGDSEVQMDMPEAPESEGPAPEPNPLPDGEPLTVSRLLEHVALLVEINLARGFEDLEPVESIDPNADFFASTPFFRDPPVDYTYEVEPPSNPEEQEELERFRENEGNPEQF